MGDAANSNSSDERASWLACTDNVDVGEEIGIQGDRKGVEIRIRNSKIIDMIEIIGTVGMILLLVGFVLNLTRKISEKSREYLVLNFVGGGLLSCYAWSLNILPFLVLELV